MNESHPTPGPGPRGVLDRPGDYIDGAFGIAPAPEGAIAIHSPADTHDLVSCHPFARSQVDAAVHAARQAFRSWRKRSEGERAALLRRYRDRLRAHADAIASCIAREAGKPLWEARAEVSAMVGKVDVSLGEGAQWTLTRSVPDLPGEIRYRPHGVLAVVGPFNFPGHLPNGQILPALWLGNTVVHKPSEKTPSTATWMARCFDEAGFPPGVVNVVQGDAGLAAALCGHADIDGVLFTGSVPVGKRIIEANWHRPGRILALELGGKNASIVLDDCDLERAARQIAFAAYATAGQRCSATSRVVATPGIIDALSDRIAAFARQVRVGHPLDDDVFMGPMIAEDARQALLDAQRRAERHGLDALVTSTPVKVTGHQGWYVRPALHRAAAPDTHVPGYTDQELFGPDITIYPARDEDQAVEVANATEYGLVAAVFTRDRERFERVADDLRVGVIHWNRSSAGASGRLPFGGVKLSGNQRPAGITTGLFCSYPQGVYLAPPDDAPLPTWPGFDS